MQNGGNSDERDLKSRGMNKKLIILPTTPIHPYTCLPLWFLMENLILNPMTMTNLTLQKANPLRRISCRGLPALMNNAGISHSPIYSVALNFNISFYFSIFLGFPLLLKVVSGWSILARICSTKPITHHNSTFSILMRLYFLPDNWG